MLTTPRSGLLSECEAGAQRQDTRFRNAVPAAKKLAVTLQWLAQGSTVGQLANEYLLGETNIHDAVHEVVPVLCDKIVNQAIKFPTSEQFMQTIANSVEAMSRPKMCVGALDGTFMHICKPEKWGMHSRATRFFSAIIILAVADADGLFTYVDVGCAWSVGDAHSLNKSCLKEKIESGEWLATDAEERRTMWHSGSSIFGR